MKRKLFLSLICLTIFITVMAQTKGPGARIYHLRSANVTRDTIYDRVKDDLAFIQYRVHDTVADVGSYDGYYPAMYSLFSDSVSFYLNDVSDEAITKFDSIKLLCESKLGRKFTNSFKIALGSELSTNLPTHTFDKVILHDALHHFTHMDDMLQDIGRVMKPGAKLLLAPWLCRGVMTKQAMMSLLHRNGFKLTRERLLPGNKNWFEFVQE
jgi:SAM-dependent methyltransferase